MTIPEVSDSALRKILTENLTPSDTIKTPERLFGREKTLKTIDRALNSAGRQIFIYGDRGVGKTSLALTAAFLHTGVENLPIYVPCGRTSQFSEIIQAIGHAQIPIKDRVEPLPQVGASISLYPAAGVWAIRRLAERKPRSIHRRPSTMRST
jgi:uncharacterized protein